MLKPAAIVAILAIASLAGCSDQGGGDNGPYLKIVGGSFIFNYRLAFAFAGVLVVAERNLPAGSTVEVSFEDPAGGPPLVRRESVEAGEDRFNFTIEPISGIKADVGYLATVRLIAADGSEMEKIERVYRSEIDQTQALPDKPLTIGPGYTPNPDAAH